MYNIPVLFYVIDVYFSLNIIYLRNRTFVAMLKCRRVWVYLNMSKQSKRVSPNLTIFIEGFLDLYIFLSCTQFMTNT